MNADIGDVLHVHGKTVGMHDQVGEIVEVRGENGTPPYLVRFGDRHVCLVFPGPDAVVEHHRLQTEPGAPRSVHDRVGW